MHRISNIASKKKQSQYEREARIPQTVVPVSQAGTMTFQDPNKKERPRVTTTFIPFFALKDSIGERGLIDPETTLSHLTSEAQISSAPSLTDSESEFMTFLH